MPFLELRSVSKAYGSTWAVREVTLEVGQGEVLSLLGPSGCGKTTTLNMIAGFIRPTGGSIVLDGAPLDGVPLERRDTAMVFQNYALFPHMTVWQNVGFGLEMRRVLPAERQSRVAEALALVGLSALGDRFPAQLSGGQQQRVALARAVVLEPKVLLLDEPLSNLDAKLRQEMRVELRRIQQSVGITTVFVTHDQEEALAVSDRIAVMNGGVIEQVGTPVEIYESPASLFVATFIGEANILDGTVESAATGALRVRLTGGGIVTARHDGSRHPPEPVSLLVRPERVRLSREGRSGANRISATVESATYVGNRIQVRLVVPGNAARLQAHVAWQRDAAPPGSGETWSVEWDVEDTAVLRSVS